jgi:hypothetical protein
MDRLAMDCHAISRELPRLVLTVKAQIEPCDGPRKM